MLSEILSKCRVLKDYEPLYRFNCSNKRGHRPVLSPSVHLLPAATDSPPNVEEQSQHNRQYDQEEHQHQHDLDVNCEKSDTLISELQDLTISKPIPRGAAILHQTENMKMNISNRFGRWVACFKRLIGGDRFQNRRVHTRGQRNITNNSTNRCYIPLYKIQIVKVRSFQ